MKLAAKILLAVFLIIGIGFYYLTFGMLDNIRARYLEGVEESLVDQASILASVVSQDLKSGSFASERFHAVFDNAYARDFSARIYELNKTGVDLRVYITDENGMIVFDSARKAKPGEDYSSWRDVWLTLNGKYGARSTREIEDQETSAVLYVASPILVKGELKGVLTVGKPTTNINSFLDMARRQIKVKSMVAVLFIITFSILAVIYFTGPIKELTRYADDIRMGIKTDLPKLDKSEIGDMGRAFENMRMALENRKYVEKYVQTLTHEIKSPLSAIKGAAELLEEEMPTKDRIRFLDNVCSETERIQRLVDRMLELSSIETMKGVEKKETISFSELLARVVDRIRPGIEGKKISLNQFVMTDLQITVDPFLIRLAISNILQNAIDFSPFGGEISIETMTENGLVSLVVSDQGPGIPDYAMMRIFEKFFSLQRPDSGKKSTGLGLNFVKEIAQLHQGVIRLENRSGGGTRTVFSLPVAKGRKRGE